MREKQKNKTYEDLSNLTLEILARRGVVGRDDVNEFISLRPQLTHDTFLLKGMEEAANRIIQAINSGETICIYGDYDADGVTSTAILLRYMESIGVDENRLQFYIPSRFDEGYGLNLEALKTLKERGVDLIITVDCGVISVDEVAYAKSQSMDIIVTDHHNAGEKLPECIVVNPKQPGCKYPFKELAGCGIAFKLVQALTSKLGEDKGKQNELLDWVALGTIADVVSLRDENRTIVKYGLYWMKAVEDNNPYSPISLLRTKLGEKKDRITGEGISYWIAPSINAAGRMSDATLGVKLLLENDPDKTEALVDQILELNSKRKGIQAELTKSLLQQAYEQKELKFPMLISAEGHEGVIGIVAGRLKEELKKPVLVMTYDDEEKGTLKGSGRSFAKINIYEVLKENEELFEKFGGHAAACGFVIKQENLPELQARTEEIMNNLDPSCFEEDSIIEAQLKAGDVSLDFVEELALLEPFGKDNPNPIFEFKDVYVRDVFPLKEGAHIKFKAFDSTGTIECIIFNSGPQYRHLLNDKGPYTVRGKLGLNDWNNTVSPQVTVKEVL